ncbi:MAG: hypothetical protein ACOC8B_05190, partial [Gemmatimonadota bacterium]
GEDQPMTPDGKYAPKGQTEDGGGPTTDASAADGEGDDAPASADETDRTDAPAAADGTDTPSAEGGTEGAPESDSEDAERTTEVPDGFVRVDVPDGHPIRHRTDHMVVPAEHEEYVRNQLNNPVRSTAVEQANARAEKARARADRLAEELARAKVRAEAGVPGDPKKLLADPEVRKVYDDLKDAYSEEHADAFLRGEHAKRAEPVQEQEEDAVRRARVDQQAGAFLEQIQQIPVEQIQSRYGVWQENGELRSRLAGALQQFSAAVERGEEEANAKEYIAFVDQMYSSDPRVQKTFQQKEQERREAELKERLASMREEIKKEIREEMEAEEREAAERHATRHPLGRVPGAVRTGRQSGDGTDDVDLSEVPAPNRRKVLRQRALSRGR